MPDGGLRRVVILTAIPVEYQAVRAHLTKLRQEMHPSGTVYERGDFITNDQSWDVLIVETGAGNTKATAETVRAIEYFKPSLVLFVGVAGGLKDVKLGDVVAATKVYGYESGKADPIFRPRPDVRSSTHRMEHRARAEAKKQDWIKRLMKSFPDPNSAPYVYVAPIASGNQIAASTDSVVLELLRSIYGDAVAVEMEGYGFLEAVHAYPHIDALIIRGISDLIDDKFGSDAKRYQEVAARHASAFAFEILAKLDFVIPPSPQESEAMPTSGRLESDAANAHQNIAQEVGETLSPQAVTLRLLREFHTTIPEHAQKLRRIAATFDGGRDICRSAIRWLDSLDGEVKKLCEEAPALSFLDLGRLQNIQEKISMLKSELEPFRHIRLWMSSGQRRENESKCEQIRHRCRELLADLDQFRRQR